MAGATVAALLTTVFTPGVSAAAETVNWSAQSTAWIQLIVATP
jgi:hypothetical protein